LTLVLDAGGLLALERGDRVFVALVKGERISGRAPVTHGGVIGQVWRGGSGRQANLARLLPGVEVIGLGDALGKRAGVLLGRTGGRDVVDAALVLLAHDGDEVVTSDPYDLALLAEAADLQVDLIPV
jgi:hypothetical protein